MIASGTTRIGAPVRAARRTALGWIVGEAGPAGIVRLEPAPERGAAGGGGDDPARRDAGAGDPRLDAALDAVARALAGAPAAWDGPLDPPGSAFEHAVWRALRRVPWGRTTTYGALARALGASPRAVGAAVGANRVFFLVPCHRVVGAGGEARGFRWGLDLKRRLLELESGQRPLWPA